MAKRKSKLGGKLGKYRSRINAEATLRFSPERSAVKSQLGDVSAQQQQDIRAARSAAMGIKAAASAAAPKIKKAYTDAGAVASLVNDEVNKDLGGLSPLADRLRGATLREQAGATRRRSEEQAGALTELASRQFDAEAGRRFQESAARDKAAGESSKLRGQLREINSRVGAFKQGRAAELGGAADDRSFTAKQKRADRRNSRIVAGVDKNGKVIPGGKAEKTAADKARPKITADGHASARARIGTVLGIAKGLKGKVGYQAMIDLVSQGAPDRGDSVDEKQYDALRKANPQMSESEAKRKATKKGVKGFKGVGDPVLARAVADIVQDGYVSRKTADQLHEAGYSVKELGLPSYGDAKAAGTLTRRGPGSRRVTRPALAPAGRLRQNRPT